jgi:hypothetical protein
MDEIFESRPVRRALVASRLVRVAEPQITWRSENADLALDDYLARHAMTGLLVAQGDTSSSSATSTVAPIGSG